MGQRIREACMVRDRDRVRVRVRVRILRDGTEHPRSMLLNHTYSWVSCPTNTVSPNSTGELQHPNHELCHRTDDVTQHCESQ